MVKIWPSHDHDTCHSNREPPSLRSHCRSRSSLRGRFHPGGFSFAQDNFDNRTSLISAFSYISATYYSWSLPLVTSRQQIIPDLCLQLHQGRLIFLHVYNVKHPSAWAVMDRGGFLCMQSQQSSANYLGRYNKSTRANHAFTRITPVLFTLMHADQIKYK